MDYDISVLQAEMQAKNGGIEFHAGGRFSLVLMYSMEGTWSEEGGKIRLVPDRWGGMTAEEYDRRWMQGGLMRRQGPITLGWNEDRSRLFLLREDTDQPEALYYVKSAGG